MGLRRYWTLYALAWVPFCGVYSLLFGAQHPVPWWYALLGALGNVLPDALIGVVVARDAQRVGADADGPARGRARRWLLGQLLVAAAVAVKVGCNLFAASLWFPDVDPKRYSFEVLGWQWFFSLTAFLVVHATTRALWTEARLRAEAARRHEAEASRARAELAALRSRLDPHFLFNTLHSLQALVRLRPESAETAIEQLGDLLRHVVRTGEDGQDDVLLADEWAFIQNYLALERLRLGERLRVVAELEPAALAAALPALSLQPLVENAIKHAIAPRPEGGTLSVRARVAGELLEVEVADDGPGADSAAHAGSGGHGLELVRRRLLVRHGARASMTVTTAPGAGFRVTLRLPLEDDE